MTNKKVFIIIINFNGWPDTEECLESLSRVEYDNFEVVLIDNGSKDNFQFSNSNFQKLKIHEIRNTENLGFAGANNQGIKLALAPSTHSTNAQGKLGSGQEADYILLLNNDTIVEPDFLTRLVGEVEEDESVGIAGPLICLYDDKNKIWSAGGKITKCTTRGELIAYQETDDGGYQAAEQVDYISGTCLLIKTEVIKKISLISEDYFLYYEDTDWCLRAKDVGWRSIVVPTAKIYHKASQSTKEFSYPYIYYHSRNGLIFGERFGNKFLVYALSVWMFFKQIIKLIGGYKRDWAKPVLRGVWDFWRGKRGKLEGFY